MTKPRIGLLVALIAVVTVIAVGAFVVLGPGRGDDTGTAGAGKARRPVDYGTTIPVSGSTVLGQQAAADALCQVQPAALASLTRISAKATTTQNLRDGLFVLDQRIALLADAAIGRPALKPLIRDLTSVRKSWDAAITADDQSHHRQAAAAITTANRRLEAMGPHLDAAFPHRGKDCQ